MFSTRQLRSIRFLWESLSLCVPHINSEVTNSKRKLKWMLFIPFHFRRKENRTLLCSCIHRSAVSLWFGAGLHQGCHDTDFYLGKNEDNKALNKIKWFRDTSAKHSLKTSGIFFFFFYFPSFSSPAQKHRNRLLNCCFYSSQTLCIYIYL